MAAADRPVAKPRPVYLNLIAIRQPLPAIVSILHRITGALLFLVGIPLLLWVVQRSLASPDAFEAAMRPLKRRSASSCCSGWRGRICLSFARGHAPPGARPARRAFNLRRRAARPRCCSCCPCC